MNVISYKILAEAIDFYGDRGYINIEIPWYVTTEIMEITKPPHIDKNDDYFIPKNGKVLVASGEQSFLYLMAKGQLPNGYYQGVTPCYRFEPIDVLHRKCFMKNELIYVGSNEDELLTELEKVILDAKDFFEKILGDKVQRVQMDEAGLSFDLTYNGEELGSYGIRSYEGLFKWVYGTGCAEPRLSIIKAKKDK